PPTSPTQYLAATCEPLLSMQSSGLRPTLLDSRHKSLPRNGWRGFSFEFGQDRGNVCELTQRHRTL
ncbi:MAG: hypothetical protein WA696_13840, partial [Solirubrobacterales bacterium]